MMHVLIAGAGFVGSRLGEILTASGHQAWGLRRNATNVPNAIAADLTRPETLLGRLPQSTTHLVFAAGPSGGGAPAYRSVYYEGLTNVLHAAEHLERLERVIFISSTSVHGNGELDWIDESCALTAPASESANWLRAAEAELHAWGKRRAPSRALAATVLRCAGIYGPGRTRLIDQVRAGASYDPTPRFMNRIHRDDVAGAVAHLLTVRYPHQVYLGVDHYPSPERETLEWLAQRLGAPAPTAAAQSSEGRRGGNKRCSNARLLASGYQFRFPTYREGYVAMLQEMAR